MSGKYTEYQQLNLPSISEEILAKWKKENTFEKSVSLREGFPPFVFYEGPPSANGMPGIHHVISRTLKDLVCRYKTMQGFQVKRKGGWDTHGLPIELGVEKELGITKEDIGVKISVEDYNKKCREVVMRFKDKWDDITQKMGYWVDLNNPYVTFENNYIETLWWCLSELYRKGYLYESVSIQPYSPAAGTGLSSHELNQPGTYKDVKDTSSVVMFRAIQNDKSQFLYESILKNNKQLVDEFNLKTSEDVYFLAWTTTPWTLPSNLGLTVGGNIDYALIKTINPYTFEPINVVLAKALLSKYFVTEMSKHEPLVGESSTLPNAIKANASEEERIEAIKSLEKSLLDNKTKKLLDWVFLAEFKGKDLEGIEYEQLLPSEANTLEKIQEITPGAQPFKVILGDFVTTEDGTGIVHTAPAFGADDFKTGQKNNLGILTLVDKQGKFIDGVGEFSGRYVKNYKDEKDYVDVNIDIAVKLKKENRAFKVEKYEHNYPHCWRTDKPIIYYPLDAWFIKTTAVKDRMIELNKTINWKPANTGTGRFGNWLENMVDWNLSRSRFWGTPLPIWKTLSQYGAFGHNIADLGMYDEVCVGSVKDLITTTSRGEWEVKGYLVDFKKFTASVRKKDALLIQKIDYHNEELGEPLDYPIYSISFQNLFERAEYRVLDKNDIKELIIPIDILKDFSTEVDEEICSTLDLHKPIIDNVVFVRKDIHGQSYIYVRVDDLIDVWFDSGAMPYAQWHFPFENKETFKANFPADFIAEGVDQTRGWFYTLHALGVLLFDSVAYKTVVSNGLVLDKAGNKMSKRLGNVVDPFVTINSFGADATRWYLITNASPWDSLKFDVEGIKEVQRKFFGTLYNTYQFFALYANVDGFAFKEKYIPVKDRPEIDQWILSSLNTLIKEVQQNFDAYEPTQAGRAIEDFVDAHLSNWYVRLCRRRFWKGEYEHDKICAYQTLYECLETLCKLMAPVAPFFADWLFNNLNSVSGRFKNESVHHTDFPKANELVIDIDLEKRMQLAQDISSLILSLRKKVNLKVRQPLQKVFIPALDSTMEARIKKVEDIIKAETNIKEIDVLGAENDFIRKKAKANFKTLGKKLGAKMKWAAEQIAAFDNATIDKVLENEYILNPDHKISGEEPIIINAEDLEVSTDEIPGFEVAVKGHLTVALDIVITDDLKKEGIAREFVNRIQNIRKDSGFNLTDRIDVIVSENEGLQPSLIQYKEYICAEILADSLAFLPVLNDGTEIEVDDVILKVHVLKKGY